VGSIFRTTGSPDGWRRSINDTKEVISASLEQYERAVEDYELGGAKVDEVRAARYAVMAAMEDQERAVEGLRRALGQDE
jgi:hypothetical protein